jgi:hypothetical protein
MRIHSYFICIAAAIFLCIGATLVNAARIDDPETVFRSPPDSAKPLVYWFWMGRNITAEGITGDLEVLKAAGFGGTTMCNLGDVCTPWPYEIGRGLNPDMVPYVSESWWKLVRHAAAESRRLGLDFGIHNCPGYESNGGPWITPELSMQEICFTQTSFAGPAEVHVALARPTVDPHANMPFPVYNADKGRVEKPAISARKTFYRDIAVLALPAAGDVPKDQVRDLTNRVAKDSTLDWEVPPGKWIVYRFGHTTMGTLIQPTIWKSTGLECDKMNPAAVAFHMDHVIGDIQRHLGDLVGQGLNFLWFDSYEAGAPSWTPKMREEFKARRGYDLTPFLPTWAHRVIGSAAESRKFAEDFRRTIFDLYRDVNFEISAQKAHAAGLRIQSEPYEGPWNIAEVVPKFDQVAGEFWNHGGQYGPMCVGEVVAGTRLAGRNVINAEAFTAGPEMSLWNETPESIKPLGDAAYCDGVNRLMLHRFTHEPWNDRYKPGVVMGQWGTHFDRTQTWWEPGKAWVQYMQRCQALLQWGKFAATTGDVRTIAHGRAKIHSIHRTDGATDVFFVANTARAGGAAKCSFSVSGKQPELWDPVTGAMRDLTEFASADGRTTIPLRFDVSQSYFIVFRKDLPAAGSPATAKNFPKLSAIDQLTGPWEISFDPKWGGPEKPVTFAALEDWTKRPEPGIKYFSGTAVYRKSFAIEPAKLAGSHVLDLGLVRHLARVKVNDKDLGVVWCAPWTVRVPSGLLKAAGNRLEIEVTNVWANRLIGDEQEPSDCQWLPGHMGYGGYLKEFPEWFIKGQPRPSIGRYCFTTWNYFTKDSPLVASGLLGPVRMLEEDWTREADDDFPPRTHAAGKVVSPSNSPIIVTTWEDNESPAAFEADVLQSDLVPIAKLAEVHAAHDGGGRSADALTNGTTLNGGGGDETVNDGKTFRGYAEGSSLTIHFDLAKSKAGYDLAKIQTFAGHIDGRASQNYTISIAPSSAPTQFKKLAQVALNSMSGASEVRFEPRNGSMLENGRASRAGGVAAVRFDFHDGPIGFNVYREIQVIGMPTTTPAPHAGVLP